MSLKDQQKDQDRKKVPTPDEIWQILKAVARRQDKMAKWQEEEKKFSAQRQEEAKRLSLQRAKEFKQEMKERQEKSDRESKQFKEDMKRELNKFRGIWSNAWGDFVETLFSGRFVELIQAWIPCIQQIIKNSSCRRGRHEWEVDIIAINSDSLVATEVKSTLGVSDVKKFLEKLKNFTLFFPQFKGYKIYGAVAYLKANEDAQTFAMKKGLFVIYATSDSGEILNKKGHFQPRIIEQADQFPTRSHLKNG